MFPFFYQTYNHQYLMVLHSVPNLKDGRHPHMYIFDKEQNKEFVEKYINFFSIGLSNILLTFDINNIIISGNLAKYIEKYQQDILKNIQKNIFFKNYPLNILCSNLNERSSILGAALIPISDFFNLVNSD